MLQNLSWICSLLSISKSLVLDFSFSAHLSTLLQLNCAVPKPPPTLITLRSFKFFSKSSFEEDLSVVPWSNIDDRDDKVDTFNSLFIDVLNMHAPLKTVGVKKNPTPWIDKTIRCEMDRHGRLFCFYRRNPTAASRDIYKAQRNRVVWLQRRAKNDYFSRLISRKSHPSVIWNTLELATSPTSSYSGNWSSFNSDSASIANTHFASVNSSTFFHPLLYSLLSPLLHLPFFPLPHHP